MGAHVFLGGNRPILKHALRAQPFGSPLISLSKIRELKGTALRSFTQDGEGLGSDIFPRSRLFVSGWQGFLKYHGISSVRVESYGVCRDDLIISTVRVIGRNVHHCNTSQHL